MLISALCLRVARGGVERPCKRERAFFLRKTCSQNGQSKKKTNRTMDHTHSARSACPARLARPACSDRPARPARPACPSRPTCHTRPARPAHDTPDIHALPALSPVARASLITRPAACGVHCMPSYALRPQPGTENTKYAEKRNEVAKCQRFGAVNRPQIIEIMFSRHVSRCVSVCNVLINRGIVKWLDKRPFCGMRVWRSC